MMRGQASRSMVTSTPSGRSAVGPADGTAGPADADGSTGRAPDEAASEGCWWGGRPRMGGSEADLCCIGAWDCSGVEDWAEVVDWAGVWDCAARGSSREPACPVMLCDGAWGSWGAVVPAPVGR